MWWHVEVCFIRSCYLVVYVVSCLVTMLLLRSTLMAYLSSSHLTIHSGPCFCSSMNYHTSRGVCIPTQYNLSELYILLNTGCVRTTEYLLVCGMVRQSQICPCFSNHWQNLCNPYQEMVITWNWMNNCSLSSHFVYVGLRLTPVGHESFICKVFLLCFTCDLPAKAAVLNVVQYNGFYGCCRCKQKGINTHTL